MSLLSPLLVLLLVSQPFWLRSSILGHSGAFSLTPCRSTLIGSWGRGDSSPDFSTHDGHPVHRCKGCGSRSHYDPGGQRKPANIYGSWVHLSNVSREQTRGGTPVAEAHGREHKRSVGGCLKGAVASMWLLHSDNIDSTPHAPSPTFFLASTCFRLGNKTGGENSCISSNRAGRV